MARRGQQPAGAAATHIGFIAEPERRRAETRALRSLWAVITGFIAAALLAGIALGIGLASSRPSFGASISAPVPGDGLAHGLLIAVFGLIFAAMAAATLGLWRQAAGSFAAAPRERR